MMKEENLKTCITIAEKAKEYLNDKEEKALVESAIKRCRQWLDNKYDIAEELYDYLDNEENGFTVFQEQETNQVTIAAWDAIIDAIAIICKSAYLESGAEYFPEPIELVDNNTVDHMLKSFLLVSENDLEKVEFSNADYEWGSC